MLRKTYLLFGLLLGFLLTLQAQSIPGSFRYSFRMNEGLSQLSVRAICQDSKGYIWIATRNGLNRFDGEEYTIYQENPEDSLSLTDNEVFSLADEQGHALWIATGRGVSRLCQHTNRIRRYQEDKGLPGSSFQVVYVDRSGRVWAGCRSGLFLYQPLTDNFTRVSWEEQGKAMAVTAIFEDSSGRFWIGTNDDRVYVCNQQMQIVRHYDNEKRKPDSTGTDVSCVYEDRSGNIWIGYSQHGVACVSSSDGSVTSYVGGNSHLQNSFVRCIVEWDGYLLVGTYDGIFAFNDITKTFSKVARYDERDYSLGHFSICAFCLSSSNMLWVGTYSGGISILSKLLNRFNRHEPGRDLNKPTGIYSNACADSKGNLWIATEGYGLLSYRPDTRKSQFYLLNEHDASRYNSNVIKTIISDKDFLWCGTAQGEIYRFDLRTHAFSLFYAFPDKTPIYALLLDSRRNLWASTIRSSSGLTCFTPDGSIIRTFKVNPDKELSISGIRCLFEERPGILLIGTRTTGLYRYDFDSQILTQYCKEEPAGSRQYIPGNYISSIDRLKSGDIWVSTYGNGIFRFNPASGATAHVSRKEGLSDNSVCKLIAGRDGNLWMSTTIAISVYNPKTEKVRNYERANGVDAREFTLHGGVNMPDGSICFTANDGFLTFEPLNMPVNTFIPPIVLKQLSVNNKPVSPGDDTGILPVVLDDVSELHLDYDENNITLSYRALNYAFSRMNRYAYKLEGYDKDWNEAGGRTSAYYTNLRPGEYTFRVRGSNNDGIWNEEGRSLHIVIHPPVWATWYAYLFYVLFASVIIGIILYYAFIRRQLSANLRMEQLDKRRQVEFHQSRLRLFTNFSHELRTPLVLIITPFEELVKQLNLPGELRERLNLIYKNAQKLLLLVNQMMDLQKNETGHMQLKVSEGNVCEFVKEIYYAFKQIAQTNEINFYLNCQPKDITAWYDRSLLEKVVFNLLSNAFKYTPSGKDINMLVTCRSYDELDENHRADIFVKEGVNNTRYLVLRIEDSGIGIAKEERDKIFVPFYQVPEASVSNVPGTGIGLSLVYSIVKLCRGNIFIEDMDRPGACFVVVLPISREAFKDDEISTSINEEVVLESGGEEEAAPQITFEKEPHQRYTILLVEDDKEVRKYLHKSLENDYQIIEAPDGVKGFDEAVNQFPDLILSDIMMPKRDGLELCSMIKNDIRTGHIPVILMTARSMVMHIKEGFSAGADDYIIKPFNMEVLRMRIRSLLEGRARLKRLYGKRFSPEEIGIEVVSADDRFSQKLFAVIEKNISDQNLDVQMLCREIGISRANLYRKLKSITELSPTELIRNKRLEVAAKMLKDSDMSVSEIALILGFNSHSYFSNSFKNFYGYTPSQFAQVNQKKVEEN